MNPRMAITLTVEKMNSASPYPRTPSRLMPAMQARNKATKIDLLGSGFQYMVVKAPAMISSGNTMRYWRV